MLTIMLLHSIVCNIHVFLKVVWPSKNLVAYSTSRSGVVMDFHMMIQPAHCASQKEMDIETSVTNYTIFWYF